MTRWHPDLNLGPYDYPRSCAKPKESSHTLRNIAICTVGVIALVLLMALFRTPACMNSPPFWLKGTMYDCRQN